MIDFWPLARNITGVIQPANALLVMLIASTPVFGQSVSSGGAFSLIAPHVGGTGNSAGGLFSLNGSIGTLTGGPLIGGNYAVTSGAPELLVIPLGNDFQLEITVTGATFRVAWPAQAVNYVLESTTTLGPSAAWQPITPAPTQNSYSSQANPPNQFFRLRR
jgi:hypothetical protein